MSVTIIRKAWSGAGKGFYVSHLNFELSTVDCSCIYFADETVMIDKNKLGRQAETPFGYAEKAEGKKWKDVKDREYPEEQPGCQREGSCKEECKSLCSMLLSCEVKVSSVVSGHCRDKGSNLKGGLCSVLGLNWRKRMPACDGQ